MNRLQQLFCALLLVLSASASQAETGIYLGGTFGFSGYDYEDIDLGTATKLTLGFTANEHIAVEASLFSTGEADITSLSGNSLKTEGVLVHLLYLVQNPKNNITGFIGGGIFNYETTLDFFGFTATEDGTGLSLILGLQYAVSDNFALRAEANWLPGVKDFAEDAMVESYQVGGVLQF